MRAEKPAAAAAAVSAPSLFIRFHPGTLGTGFSQSRVRLGQFAPDFVGRECPVGVDSRQVDVSVIGLLNQGFEDHLDVGGVQFQGNAAPADGHESGGGRGFEDGLGDGFEAVSEAVV